jgi:AraC-like DNA-binding protein/mannose-6-phosphate isomerase-like protein (cupin superfamily)
MAMFNALGDAPAYDLREAEVVLKEISRRYSKRNPSLPHNYEEIQDILSEANRLSDGVLEHVFLQILQEKHFFHQDMDVEIYQHLRYLPAQWHRHDFIEIACVLQGECINYFPDQELRMIAGDICIIAPETRHAISVFEDECILYNILLRTSTFHTAFFGTLNDSGILAEFFTRLLYHTRNYPYLLFRTGEDPELSSCIQFAAREFRQDLPYRNRMMTTIMEAFFIVLLRSHESQIVLPSYGAQTGNENVVQILKYMQDHYATVSLAELSSVFSYSQRQLQRIIKEATGIGFSDNLRKIKLLIAARLLRNTSMSVAEIAVDVGYDDVTGFRQAFKLYYNKTPSQYRQSDP